MQPRIRMLRHLEQLNLFHKKPTPAPVHEVFRHLEFNFVDSQVGFLNHQFYVKINQAHFKIFKERLDSLDLPFHPYCSGYLNNPSNAHYTFRYDAHRHNKVLHMAVRVTFESLKAGQSNAQILANLNKIEGYKGLLEEAAKNPKPYHHSNPIFAPGDKRVAEKTPDAIKCKL